MKTKKKHQGLPLVSPGAVSQTTTKKPVRNTRDLIKQTNHDRDPDIDNRTLDELRSLGYIK